MTTSDPPVGLPEGDLTGPITRLAAELFAQAPGSAGHVPPVPGAAATPPLWAVAPPPTESDLRTLPSTMANALGGSAPLALVETPPAAASLTPYFLGIAGHPSPASPVAPAFPAPPSATAAPANGVPAGAPEISPALSPALSIVSEFQPELVPDLPSTGGIFDPLRIKRDFPILEERVHGRRLVWLDNAATTQKPRAVIERLAYFYEHENSNVHRAAHELAARATDAYESARDKTARFLNAPSAKNIVFVRGTTEAINLVAQSWGRRHVGQGDEIVISWLEHHANIVPWQQLTAATGARLRVAPVDDHGQVILEEYEKLLGPRTRLVSISQVSNALGTIVPVKEMIDIAHRYGARVLIDGAQAVSHLPVDVQALDCDFYCFSGHKIFAPTGIGALFGKTDVLETMPPWQGGGNMISDVRFEKTTYQAAPLRFEAGTGNIADAVGLGAALDYVNTIGRERIGAYEHELLEYATRELGRVSGLQMIGTAPEKAGVLSFVLDGARTEDVGKALDQEGIAVRSGHHCAQPILRRFGLESTVRASLAPYNTCEDVDALVAALLRIQSGRTPGQ
ncbi:MAG TPA: family 2A encapsulin nanocompartment cargo protein cysteine desulfurase [Polyangia bacterium]|jgi:cysteine desulfurase/selenocysteine lyase|nr:family 2A encapsulin nanocompartment cargo protein cysteine desulfurase [Polyangia bacterium]